MKTNYFLLIALLVFLVYMAVILVLPPTLIEHLASDYSDTGQIGDTVGGFLGPLIAIGAAALTFAAFCSQIAANRIQRSDLQKERFENNFFNLIDLLNRLTCDTRIREKKEVNVGKQAFHFMFYEYKAIVFKLHLNLRSQSLSNQQINKIGYSLFINGVSKTSTKRLRYDNDILNTGTISDINDMLWNERDILQKGTPVKYLMDYAFQAITLYDGHRLYLVPFYNNVCLIVKYIYDTIQGSKYWNKRTKEIEITRYFEILCSQLFEHQMAILNIMHTYDGLSREQHEGINMFFSDYLQGLISGPGLNCRDKEFIDSNEMQKFI